MFLKQLIVGALSSILGVGTVTTAGILISETKSPVGNHDIIVFADDLKLNDIHGIFPYAFSTPDLSEKVYYGDNKHVTSGLSFALSESDAEKLQSADLLFSSDTGVISGNITDPAHSAINLLNLRILAFLDGYNSLATDAFSITLSPHPDLTLSGGTFDLFGQIQVPGADTSSWTLKDANDQTVPNDQITWSLFPGFIRNIAITDGLISWSSFYYSTTSKFKVKATYYTQTFLSPEITLHVNSAWSISGGDSELVGIINQGGIEPSAWDIKLNQQTPTSPYAVKVVDANTDRPISGISYNTRKNKIEWSNTLSLQEYQLKIVVYDPDDTTNIYCETNTIVLTIDHYYHVVINNYQSTIPADIWVAGSSKATYVLYDGDLLVSDSDITYALTFTEDSPSQSSAITFDPTTHKIVWDKTIFAGTYYLCVTATIDGQTYQSSTSTLEVANNYSLDINFAPQPGQDYTLTANDGWSGNDDSAHVWKIKKNGGTCPLSEYKWKFSADAPSFVYMTSANVLAWRSDAQAGTYTFSLTAVDRNTDKILVTPDFKVQLSITCDAVPLSWLTISGSTLSGPSSQWNNSQLNKYKTLMVPTSVSYVGPSAFDNKLNTSNLTLSFASSSHTVNIGDSAFANNSNLTTVNLPSNIDYIYANAFLNCSSLSKINVSGNPTLSDGSFTTCTTTTINFTNQTFGDYCKKLLPQNNVIQDYISLHLGGNYYVNHPYTYCNNIYDLQHNNLLWSPVSKLTNITFVSQNYPNLASTLTTLSHNTPQYRNYEIRSLLTSVEEMYCKEASWNIFSGYKVTHYHYHYDYYITNYTYYSNNHTYNLNASYSMSGGSREDWVWKKGIGKCTMGNGFKFSTGECGRWKVGYVGSTTWTDWSARDEFWDWGWWN